MVKHGPPLALSTSVDGRTWYLFACEFDSADGRFGFYIHALSHEHAEMLLSELRATAKVQGRVEEIIPGPGCD